MHLRAKNTWTHACALKNFMKRSKTRFFGKIRSFQCDMQIYSKNNLFHLIFKKLLLLSFIAFVHE